MTAVLVLHLSVFVCITHFELSVHRGIFKNGLNVCRMLTAKGEFASEWSVWGRIVDSRGPRILLAYVLHFFLVDTAYL